MDADPDALLEAFLRVHAQESSVPAALYAHGVQLHGRLLAAPPAIPAWGRFLIVLGELAADHLHDDHSASRHFLAALESVRVHGDGTVAVVAGYNQAVLHERRGDTARALIAYRTAAGLGFDLGINEPALLRAGEGAVRLSFAHHQRLLSEDRLLLKRVWLAWLWTHVQPGAQRQAELDAQLGRTLAAFLLPEDEPARLAADWRAWAPAAIAAPDGEWRDDHPTCLIALFAAAAAAADAHLTDEGGDPGMPYRLLRDAAQRLHPDG